MDRPTAIRQTRTRAPTHPTPLPITMGQPATRRRANPEAPNRPAPATRALRSTPTVGRRATPGPAATAPRLRVPRPKMRRVVATAEPEAPRSLRLPRRIERTRRPFVALGDDAVLSATLGAVQRRVTENE